MVVVVVVVLVVVVVVVEVVVVVVVVVAVLVVVGLGMGVVDFLLHASALPYKYTRVHTETQVEEKHGNVAQTSAEALELSLKPHSSTRTKYFTQETRS